MNNRYKTNLRLSKLMDKSALAENLVTSNKRRYNDAVVQQLLSFRFAEERLNVGIYGITEVGKSYFMSAFCNEACRRNYAVPAGLETHGRSMVEQIISGSDLSRSNINEYCLSSVCHVPRSHSVTHRSFLTIFCTTGIYHNSSRIKVVKGFGIFQREPAHFQ